MTSPDLSTSDSLPTQPQDTSVMRKRPSTPPTSTKAPNAVRLVTVPLRTFPTSKVFNVASRLTAASRSNSLRRETTTFPLWVSISMIRTGDFLSQPDSQVFDRTTVHLGGGKKASIPTSTMSPPLTERRTVPSNVPPASRA
jgi:hypothetical protein